MSALERIVVVGNGIAGQTACDALRLEGFDGELTIIGDETCAAYSRPALSKTLLADGGSHELPAPTHGATELLGRSAKELDLSGRRVILDDDTAVPFDGLVIATGSRARRLGAPDSNEHTLRTLDDALALRDRLTERPSVAILGAGALGMEIASAAITAGCEVTLVANMRPMRVHLGEYLSELLVSEATAQGLKLVDGTATDIVDGTMIVLEDDSRLEADLVVTTIGDVANVEWLQSSGLLSSGVLQADTRGRVAPSVVAAGDVATIPTPWGVRRIPLWSSAIDQAKVAARALLLGDEAPELDHKPYFWTEQFGLNIKAIGALPVDGEPEFVVGDSPRGPSVMRWEYDRAGERQGTAVAVNARVPIPKLRRMAAGA